MAAEIELISSWMRWFLPKAQSQNVLASIPPQGTLRTKVVLCAHLDTHRTPIFYSTQAWQKAFSILTGAAILSMLIGSIVGGAGLILGWSWLRFLYLAISLIQGFALVMCIHADFTPFSPGANDNASGAAILIGIAMRLIDMPLDQTEVDLVFTGCEEVGDWGMQAFLDAHAFELGKEAHYIIIDQVGAGEIKYLTSDGLLIKHRTHPLALQLARKTSARRPDLRAFEGVGVAYTDALKATRQGLIALTLCAAPRSGNESSAHWHQMSDRLENILPEDLNKAFEFTWELLQSLIISTDNNRGARPNRARDDLLFPSIHPALIIFRFGKNLPASQDHWKTTRC